MRALATLGLIPRKYRHLDSPVCKSCQYGKQHRKPWRTKGQKSKIKPVTTPGQCISVDQMESSLPGFVAQLKGSLTTRRYKGATIFKDHATGFIHVSLMTDFTGEATVTACREFEAHSREMGVEIRHYHCDNGRFADNKFLSHCKLNHISVSFCGVNAHHQNGLAERTIGLLRDEARVALWHAIFRWPSMLLLNLWPYAVRHAAEVRNTIPSTPSGASPIELYSQSEVGAQLKNFYTIFCPVYQLDSSLASGKKIRHWDSRSRLGINLGRSPRHARNVNLILNPATGLVSPQFHVCYDDFFESVRINKDNEPQLPLWHTLSGLRQVDRNSRSVDIALTRRRIPFQPTRIDPNLQSQPPHTDNEVASTLGDNIENAPLPPDNFESVEEQDDSGLIQASQSENESPVVSEPMSFARSTLRSSSQTYSEIKRNNGTRGLQSF